MNLRLLLVALAALFFVAAPAKAQLLLEENFNYAAPSVLVGQGGWAVTGGAATPVINVTANNLTFTGYPSVTGNAVSLASSGQDANRPFAPQNTGTVYASFLVRVASAGTGDYFFHLGPDQIGSQFVARVFARVSSGEVQFGVLHASGGSPAPLPTYATNTYPLNSTVLVVVKYQILPGQFSDVSSIYTFAEGEYPSTEPGTPRASSTNPNGFDPVTIGTIALRQGSTTAGVSPTAVVDGIRVGRSFAEVLPAPPAPTAFAITSPTAGQVYRAGAKLKPTWTTTPSGATGSVTVTLRKAGSEVATIYAGPNLEDDGDPNTPGPFGPARYDIPAGIPGGTDYTVYIALDGNPAVNAESGAFEITAQPFVVSNPAGGELYNGGQTVSVTFGLGGLMAPRARIYLRSAGSGSELIATEESSDGQVDVVLPLVPDGDDYRIVVRLNEGTTKLTARSNTFNIATEAAARPHVSHFGTVAGDVGTEMWLDVAAPSLADGSEVGVFAGSVLVGTARVAGGYADVRVTGVADGTTLSLRSFDGAAERTVETAAAVVFADGAETEVALKGDASSSASLLTVGVSPNPASGVATLRVSSASAVRVYDALGRVVADLGTVEAEARWDASGVAPGVYVVRATSADATVTIRVTVAR